MSPMGIFQILAYFLVLLTLTKPLGLFMAKVFQGGKTFLHPVLRPVERVIYKLAGVDEMAEQRWTQYTASLLAFSIACFVFVYVIQRLQGVLPLNPQQFGSAQTTPD